MLTLTVFMPPTPKQRPVVTREHGVYTPAKTVRAERLIAEAWRAKYSVPLRFADHIPLRLTVICYFKKPVRARRKYPTVRPDWDNLGKMVSDALNGLAYHDDKQIVSATVEKQYGDPERIEITLEVVE